MYNKLREDDAHLSSSQENNDLHDSAKQKEPRRQDERRKRRSTYMEAVHGPRLSLFAALISVACQVLPVRVGHGLLGSLPENSEHDLKEGFKHVCQG